MVGIVLVSHSRALALSVQELVRSMTGPNLKIAIAAGTGENQRELGTDAVEIAEAIVSVRSDDGVLILMDMGSAILSAETALDLLEAPQRNNVRFCAAAFVEGAVAAGVTANLGASLDDVCREALASLKMKQAALEPDHGFETKAPRSLPASNGHTEPPPEQKIRLTIRNPHGLHARPAARLIDSASHFHANITVQNLTNRRGPASMKSLSGLTLLEILQGHEIEVAASGDDAANALQEIALLVEGGLGDTLPVANKVAPSGKQAKPEASPKKSAISLIPLSGGIAVGPGIYFHAAKLEIPQEKTTNIPGEIDRLQNAIAQARKNLDERREKMSASLGLENGKIYEAQSLALSDPELIETAVRNIETDQLNAALAWDVANQQIVARYQSIDDSYLRERSADIADVGRQVLELLVDHQPGSLPASAPGILIADDLTPTEVAALDRENVLGVILLDGNSTSHSSILIRALGIPAVAQARAAFDGINLHEPLTVAIDANATRGKVWVNPATDFLHELETRQATEKTIEAQELKASALATTTFDGRQVDVFANIGDASEVETALRCGAEGVGLLRTEFLFLDRATAPTEDEQVTALLAIVQKMNGKPVIVRTLDVGGDKDVPYLVRATENNPFLGMRAIRLFASHEELFSTHLRAILRAGFERDLRIMFPMIANVTDLNEVTAFLEKVHADLVRENVPHLWPVKTGIMIEIPSAAIQAESMARQVDFFSIGTNDLTQYTLAADRGNPELSAYHDALHPAVLRLIEMVVRGAHKHQRMVAVCGEAAADELAAAVFIGLGVHELSLTGAKIPHIKACLRKHTFAHLQKLAHSALHCHTAEEVRALTP